MAQHPLEPLGADEFTRTTEILRREGHFTDTFRFASIELLEPAKQEVLAWRAGDAVPRRSFAVMWNRSTALKVNAYALRWETSTPLGFPVEPDV